MNLNNNQGCTREIIAKRTGKGLDFDLYQADQEDRKQLAQVKKVISKVRKPKH